MFSLKRKIAITSKRCYSVVPFYSSSLCGIVFSTFADYSMSLTFDTGAIPCIPCNKKDSPETLEINQTQTCLSLKDAKVRKRKTSLNDNR